MNTYYSEESNRLVKGFTVIDRLAVLGVETEKHDRWVLGAAVRDQYRKDFGVLPEKALRLKTRGVGSHCFAVYPQAFEVVVDGIIEAFKFHKDRQLSLFE